MGRGIKEIAMIDEMKEERERKSKKKITSAARLLGEDLLSTLVRLRSPFPNTTPQQRPASSTKFNLVALLLPSRNPLFSPPRFRRQPTRLTIARLPDPHDRMAKRMRESIDAADELPCVHRRRRGYMKFYCRERGT